MTTHATDLRVRTEEYALAVIELYVELPHHAVAQVLGKQCLRSGTSVGAHYREAGRARSVAEFISKMEGAEQELDETEYWLTLLKRRGLGEPKVTALLPETDELMAIFAASVITAKKNRERSN